MLSIEHKLHVISADGLTYQVHNQPKTLLKLVEPIVTASGAWFATSSKLISTTYNVQVPIGGINSILACKQRCLVLTKAGQLLWYRLGELEWQQLSFSNAKLFGDLANTYVGHANCLWHLQSNKLFSGTSASGTVICRGSDLYDWQTGKIFALPPNATCWAYSGIVVVGCSNGTVLISDREPICGKGIVLDVAIGKHNIAMQWPDEIKTVPLTIGSK